MKKIKVAVFGILILMGFLAMGELSILNLDTFQEKYYDTEFYIDNSGRDTTSREMAEDLCRAGDKHDVDFFTVRYSWDKSYLYDTEIIGTDGAIDHLKKSGVREGRNRSLFFGSQNVTFSSITEEKDVSDMTVYYLIGNESDYDRICAFKSDLVDKYGGGFPKEKGSDSDILMDTIVVWAVIFAIILALSLYETACLKKETMIRVLMGEDILKIFLRSVITDTISFAALFTLMSLILQRVSNVTFKYHWVICMFIAFLILNAIISTRLLRPDYKRDLASGEGDNSLLAINYVLKAVLTIIAIAVISINCGMIHESLKIYEQKDFFRSHDNCSYYKISYGFDMTSEINDPDESLYRDFYAKFQNRSFQYADLSEYYDMRHPFIVINRNAFDELSAGYPQLKTLEEKVTSGKISLLLPSDIVYGTSEYEKVMEMNDGSFFTETEYGSWKKLNYDDGIKVTGIHESGQGYETNSYSDPVILVDNTTYDGNPGSTGYDFYYNYDIMYDIPDKDWRQFVETHDLDDSNISVTNVMDDYSYRWAQSKRKLTISAAFTLFILFLELSLIIMIIKMEYQFNAAEMAIRKIHGYSLYERNIRLVKETVVSGMTGIIAASILCRITGADIGIPLLAASGLLLIILEIICILVKAGSVENHKIATILKGERI